MSRVQKRSFVATLIAVWMLFGTATTSLAQVSISQVSGARVSVAQWYFFLDSGWVSMGSATLIVASAFGLFVYGFWLDRSGNKKTTQVTRPRDGSDDAVATIAPPPASAGSATQVSDPPSPVAISDCEKRTIFVSYRRHDSQHISGRIYDRLVIQFGKENVFKDVDSIPLGLDFREHLRKEVGKTSLVVAVIGKDWHGSSSGKDRLNDPRDYLRIEIETALERGIPVIPVLVDGVEMPDEEELPASLAQLAYYNGIAVRPDPDFHHDAGRLVKGIQLLWG